MPKPLCRDVEREIAKAKRLLKAVRHLRTLDDMHDDAGSPLSVRELALMIGMSVEKVRTDIAAGALDGKKVPCKHPGRFWFRIPYLSAQAYLVRLEFIIPQRRSA